MSSIPPIPPDLAAHYQTWDCTAVSVHPGNSAMFRLRSAHGEVHFLKVVRSGWHPSAEAEAERLIWAGHHLPVPMVIDSGSTPASTWVLTDAMAGLDATNEAFRSDTAGLVRRLAVGLRRFHEAPATSCPFNFRIDDALTLARDRLDHGVIDPARDFHPEHAHLSAQEAVRKLESARPPAEDAVVCHGDYCVPNILMNEKGVVGYVDLGELGVSDRWWDLAVATWSLTWNFGPGYESLFLDAYGVGPNEHKMRFYRLLYDVVS